MYNSYWIQSFNWFSDEMAFFPCLFILIVKTVLSQFIPHVDLQKLGEITIKGQRYNFLKPTVHKVTNHFEDEKLRRDTGGDERVFIDDYGFRHFWEGLENRKSENGIENYRREGDIFDDMNKEGDSILRSGPVAKKPPNPAVKRAAKPAVKRAGKPAPKPAPKPTAKPTAKPAAKPAAAKPATKPAAAKPAAQPAATKQLQPKAVTEANSNKTASVAGDRTIGKSYFFCPFFGVIAMKAFID